tara:strand:+ start:4024 stop:4272 length:249 start_codon:yes stop_codon:yes gene_type:complete
MKWLQDIERRVDLPSYRRSEYKSTIGGQREEAIQELMDEAKSLTKRLALRKRNSDATYEWLSRNHPEILAKLDRHLLEVVAE